MPAGTPLPASRVLHIPFAAMFVSTLSSYIVSETLWTVATFLTELRSTGPSYIFELLNQTTLAWSKATPTAERVSLNT
jgi:hypothetical protein